MPSNATTPGLAPTRRAAKFLPAVALQIGLLLSPALAVAATCYPGTEAEPLEPELIYEATGGSYLDANQKTIIDHFERECGVKVVVNLNPRRSLAELKAHVERGGVPWDLTTVNTPWDFQTGVREGLFEPLPAGFWDPVKERLAEGSYNDYALWQAPYSWVITYNKDSVQGVPQNWADFWDTAKFPGPRSLQDSPTNILLALLADGVAPGDLYPIDDAKLKRAFAKLDELRPDLRTFWTAGDQPVQGVSRGDFVMASAFNGRAYAGIRSGYPIDVQWNQNLFTIVWIYRPKGAPNPRSAAAFLHFLTRQDRQAEMAALTGYAGALRDPESFLAPQVAQELATSSSHLAQSVQLDPIWWTDNIARVQALWTEWVTTGTVTLQ